MAVVINLDRLSMNGGWCAIHPPGKKKKHNQLKVGRKTKIAPSTRIVTTTNASIVAIMMASAKRGLRR
jgi:hypothetical protein